MPQQTFFIDKTTDTFADALAAFGLAKVLQEILHRAKNGGEVQLEDGGGYYRLICTPAIEDDWPSIAAHDSDGSILPIFGAPIVRTQKNAASLPDDLPDLPAAIVDYEAERERNNTYWEARKQLPKEARQALSRGEYEHPALQGLPDQVVNWDIYRLLNPAGLIGYNSLMVQWWQARQSLPNLLHILLQMTVTTPNDVAGAEAAWNKLAKERDLTGASQATASQIYNPGQGKGQNRTKADNLSMNNVKNFWLLEWLKAVGFYEAALTKQLQGSKDRKTYVLAPRRVIFSEHQKIMTAFRHKMLFSETATRSDILATIRYTRTFLEYCQQDQSSDLLALLLSGSSPDQVISGFNLAFYKNLGQSAAVMNLSFINLPGWVRPQSAAEVADFLAALEEHEVIVRQLDESHSDVFDLLQRYRDFITGNDLGAFFDFTTPYSSYLVSQKERGRYAPQFTIENLRRLIMNAEPKLSDILDKEKHPGFHSIAYAIRQSTVVAQYRKQQGDRRYDVRYGLGQELARKAKYPDQFITALSDFLHKYNAENAQVMETRSGPYRHSIQVNDIDDLVALVDEYGSELICNLLVAYGYARSPREGQPVEVPDDEIAGVEAAISGVEP